MGAVLETPLCRPSFWGRRPSGRFAWVYISAFSASTAGYSAALRFVLVGRSTRHRSSSLIFMLPTIALICLAFASGDRRGRTLALVWLTFLMFSEYFYVDDVYSGIYDRFNTTLKWWPWIAAGTLMLLGPLVLEHARRRWVRIAGFVVCLHPCFYVFGPLARAHRRAQGIDQGKIEGTPTSRKTSSRAFMLDRLKVEKPGVAVERPEGEGGFTNSAVIPLFAGQRMWPRLVGTRAAVARVPRGHPAAVPEPRHSLTAGRCRGPANGSRPRASTTFCGTGRATSRSCGTG